MSGNGSALTTANAARTVATDPAEAQREETRQTLEELFNAITREVTFTAMTCTGSTYRVQLVPCNLNDAHRVRFEGQEYVCRPCRQVTINNMSHRGPGLIIGFERVTRTLLIVNLATAEIISCSSTVQRIVRD